VNHSIKKFLESRVTEHLTYEDSKRQGKTLERFSEL